MCVVRFSARCKTPLLPSQFRLSACLSVTLVIHAKRTQEIEIKVKVKGKGKCIAVCINTYTATGNHLPYGITQCYLPPGRGDFPPLTQPKLALDLATPKGCKAELT